MAMATSFSSFQWCEAVWHLFFVPIACYSEVQYHRRLNFWVIDWFVSTHYMTKVLFHTIDMVQCFLSSKVSVSSLIKNKMKLNANYNARKLHPKIIPRETERKLVFSTVSPHMTMHAYTHSQSSFLFWQCLPFLNLTYFRPGLWMVEPNNKRELKNTKNRSSTGQSEREREIRLGGKPICVLVCSLSLTRRLFLSFFCFCLWSYWSLNEYWTTPKI